MSHEVAVLKASRQGARVLFQEEGFVFLML